ncbi:MAG: hypothetical protein JWO63_1614, partial [Frankiales bacterium]|nr:hypothetical protein [Frankiales bacterium]
LSDVQAGSDHEDLGEVSGVGVQSMKTVTDTNPYYAALTPRVSVGDYVWVDSNHDGIQDAGEPPIPGVTLSLTGPDGQPVTDVNGNPVAPVVTDAQGKYEFAQLPVLPAGQHYTVTLDQAASAGALAGYRPTTAGAGADRAVDSSTGSATSQDLTVDGSSDQTLDFGYVKPVSIGDYVWIDQNHNGVQDNGEKGVPGVRITVTTPEGQPVTDLDGHLVGPATTDASGLYHFDDLPPGQYVTHIDYGTAPAGYLPTVPGHGTRSTDSSTDSATSLLLESGQSDESLDFGLWQPGPAVSIVKKDLNGNDADTSGTAVTLSDGSAGLVYTVTNTGDEALTDIKVSDQLVTGGSVTGLSCTFGDQSTGTSWSGPFAPGASFTCTATLSDLAAGSDHEDLGVVAGVGQQSKVAVGASNPYFAHRPAAVVVDAPTGVDTGSTAGHRLSPLLQAGGYFLVGVAGLLAMLALLLWRRPGRLGGAGRASADEQNLR